MQIEEGRSQALAKQREGKEIFIELTYCLFSARKENIATIINEM